MPRQREVERLRAEVAALRTERDQLVAACVVFFRSVPPSLRHSIAESDPMPCEGVAGAHPPASDDLGAWLRGLG
jgi:hypothetical protein